MREFTDKQLQHFVDRCAQEIGAESTISTKWPSATTGSLAEALLKCRADLKQLQASRSGSEKLTCSWADVAADKIVKMHLDSGGNPSLVRRIAAIINDFTPSDLAWLLSRNAVLEKALRAADQFITNGRELGFIRMPDADTPDPAHHTPGIIRAALEQPE